MDASWPIAARSLPGGGDPGDQAVNEEEYVTADLRR
jgi:hypothetical protein